jgi:preprotein translocase subunit SecD
MTKPLTFAKPALPSLLAFLLVAACGPSPGGKDVERPACADPAATSRVNFHLVVDRDGVDPFPGADVLTSPAGESVTVRRKVVISGRRILRASSTFDPSGRPTVAIQFDSQGADDLAAVTAANTGRRIALVVDGVLISAPRVQGTITARSIQLTGGMTPETASEVAVRINQILPDCVAPVSAPVATPSSAQPRRAG